MFTELTQKIKKNIIRLTNYESAIEYPNAIERNTSKETAYNIVASYSSKTDTAHQMAVFTD